MREAKKLQKLIRETAGWSVSQCQDILDELDKPELDPEHRKMLSRIMDRKGCVVKLDGEWRQMALAVGGGVDLSETRTFNALAKEMIDLDLLTAQSVYDGSGMELYAIITNAGERALQE